MTTTTEQKLAFAKRFNLALDLFGAPQKNQGRSLTVAEMFGLTPRGSARWVNGEVLPPKKRRRQIAERLEVNYDWLEFGHHEPKTSAHASLVKKLPLLDQNEAKDHKKIIAGFHGRRFSFETESSNESFAVRTTGKAMEPRFPANTILVIDPTVTPKDGDFVLVHVHRISEVLFRKWMQGDAHNHLIALNDSFSSVPVYKEDRVIGVALEAQQSLR